MHTINRRSFLASTGAFLGCLTAGALRAAQRKSSVSKQPPNIVFILIDDLGWKDVGFMGSRYYETPNIDRLASGGMIFTSAYSGGPNCAPTRACLLTGMYTPRTRIYTPGATSKGNPHHMKLQVPTRQSSVKRHLGKGVTYQPEPFPSVTTLDPKAVTVAEVLKQAKYISASMGKWHMGDDPERGPTGQGFDINIAGGSWGGPYNGGYHSPYRYPNCVQEKPGEYLTDRLTDEAIRFIEKHRNGPFFLYLPHYAVHSPWQAKEKLVRKYRDKAPSMGQDNATYAAMIESADQGVGRIMETLDRLKLTGNTLVIFSSDNGGVKRITKMPPLRGGKGSLYEGGVRVPTCMRWPGSIKPGTKCDVPIASVDLLPTFAEIADVPLPSSQPVDGVSFLPLLKGKHKLPRDAIFWHFPLYLSGANVENYIPVAGGRAGEKTGWRQTPAGSVRKGDWKLIQFFDDMHVELYDLKNDIGEEHDLAEEKPDKARELLEVLQKWQNELKAPIPTGKNPHYRE